MQEEIIDPSLPICDPHHHLWEYPDNRYMMEELRADTGSGHNVEQTVFVECKSGYRADGADAFAPVGETEFVVAADSGGIIAGIVSYVDLRLPEVADVLAAHVEAGDGRFRGIRHASAWDASDDIRPSHSNPPPDLFADPAFGAGIEALGRAGLSYDAWLFHPQIPELTELAWAHPDVQIICDHLGGPLGIGPYAGHREEVLAKWRVDMEALATCENVALKLGGIGMPIFGLGWHKRDAPASSEELAAAWGDDIRWCIERFGIDRCMFESNFPVDKASCSYAVLWNAFKRIVADASSADTSALFADTAARVYRL